MHLVPADRSSADTSHVARLTERLLVRAIPSFDLLLCYLLLFQWAFRLVGFGAIMTTAVACVLFTVQIVRDGMAEPVPPPQRKVHGFEDFFLSFGTLLFAFGGASTFPTIQNDMQNKKKFSTSILMAFIGTWILIRFLCGEKSN